MTSAAAGVGSCPNEDTSQSENCNTQPCPIDCVGDWAAWGSCSVDCGGGEQTRGFVVAEPAELGGLCTHEGIEQSQVSAPCL